MRPAAALSVLSCLLVAGCGGSGQESTPEEAGPGGGETLEQLWSEPGDDVTAVPATASYEPGDVRVSFLVIDGAGEPVTLPTAHLWLARKLDGKPFLESKAKLERIGVPGGAEADSTHVYVAHVPIRRPGTYWYLAEPEGGPKDIRAIGSVVVDQDLDVPGVGEPAPASDTPTLATVGGDAARLTTRTPPDVTLLEHSVADSLRAGHPFVVTFATPKFCSSRTCGPVVDVVEEVAREFEDTDVRFIHVEIYEDLNPALGYNRGVKEWGLPTEPWTFVVGANGRIVERFEGPVSVHELEAAVGPLAGG
jgi:hypothetical protein